MAFEDFVFSVRWWDLRGSSAEDAVERRRVEDELIREVAPGHPVHGQHPAAVASCTHCDDCLFMIDGNRFAVVHLSWPEQGPDRPPWPDTDVCDNWEAVEAYLSKHDDW